MQIYGQQKKRKERKNEGKERMRGKRRCLFVISNTFKKMFCFKVSTVD